MKILVVRNDKIGDFVLALPSFKAIKMAFPHVQVVALVPTYTSDIANACEWIDRVIIDPKDRKNIKKLAKQLESERFDASVCLFSDSYNASLVKKARIPVRVAPATKWVQILYTHTLKQRRSRSEKPEFEYNLDLAYYFIKVLKGEPQKVSPFRLLSYDEKTVFSQKAKLEKIGIQFDRKVCFIHPSTGGSSNSLLQDQWVELMLFLNGLDDFYFVITAGPGEEDVARSLVNFVGKKIDNVALYDKNDGVSDFMRSVACADLFIAGSTGPLHIAGALDIPTIGFYSTRRSAMPIRWKTLNSEGGWLPLTPSVLQKGLHDIKISAVSDSISSWYNNVSNNCWGSK